MPFEFKPQAIEDLILIEPKFFKDERGYFLENFKFSDFSNHNIKLNVFQSNISLSKKYVLRGIHYQIPPKAQGKLISVLRGKIYDVAVDLRQSSPTFGKSVGVYLDDKSRELYWIPEGFGHGFLSLVDQTVVQYFTTSEYSSRHERSIHWADPVLKINWSISSPIVSSKDKRAPMLAEQKDLFE